jgi:hypothetical protein
MVAGLARSDARNHCSQGQKKGRASPAETGPSFVNEHQSFDEKTITALN